MSEYTNEKEWKTDKWGKRYRIIDKGGILIEEHEMEVQTTIGTLPRSRLNEVKKEKQRMDEEFRKSRAEPIETPRRCPFSETGKRCDDKCAFHGDQGCLTDPISPKGKKCPFSPYTCGSDCVMYDNGCKLINVAREVI